jgi:hypothetical protein
MLPMMTLVRRCNLGVVHCAGDAADAGVGVEWDLTVVPLHRQL